MEEGEYVTGKIRKVTIGSNPIDAFACPIGMTGKDFKVVEIIRDLNYTQKFGGERIIIIAKNTSDIRFVWKESINQPVLLDYFDPRDKPEDHV